MIVRSDLPTAELRRAAVTLDEIAGGLALDGLTHAPLRVRLYRTRAQLDAHARDFGLEGAAGFYDAQRREVVLAAEGLAIHAAAHELTHAILHARHGTIPAPWIAEGAAECAAARLLRRWGMPVADAPAAPEDVRRMTYERWSDGDADSRRARYLAARAWFERRLDGTVDATYGRLAGP